MYNIETIKTECSAYCDQTIQSPLLLKRLPKTNDFIRKVKVRQQKNKDNFITDALNASFSDYKNLIQRSVFCSKNPISENDNTDLFYVFPVNGFKFIYNPVIKNTFKDYEASLYQLIKELPLNSTLDIFSEMVKLGYITSNLNNGINSGAEIIIYGIPHYFAIKKTFYDNYTAITKIV